MLPGIIRRSCPAAEMDRLFISFPYSPPPTVEPPAHGSRGPSSMTVPSTSRFLELPSEIIHHILRYLPPPALAELSAACRSLRTHAEDDLLWASFVQNNLPISLPSPSPCKTWKELYISHHPYWFLPRHKLWFADKGSVGNGLAGQLLIARYDPRVGCIEGYRLVAEFAHGLHLAEHWEWDREVIIHRFTPTVRLFMDSPMIKLDIGSLPAGPRLQKEISMQRDADRRTHGIRSTLFLTRSIPLDKQDPTMSLWPPRILPALDRVRNHSPTVFRGDGHKPQHLRQMSENAFRMRKWVEFRAATSVRMGEDVLTFSTLAAEYYTPTTERPYQGIWIGDYAGHGCEFLVLIQSSTENKPRHVLAETGQLVPSADTDVDPVTEGIIESEDPPGCSGRLEAIKLTGDANIPRGEYTWISEDIGRHGLIRIADERPFKSARIVRSWGHIAADGFRNGKIHCSPKGASWL